MMVVMVVVLGLVMLVMVMCDGVGDTGHDGGGDEWLVRCGDDVGDVGHDGGGDE